MPRTRGTPIRYAYTAEPQPEGTFLVQFLDFPEGVTEGATPEEAAKYAQEVLDLIITSYLDEGKALPTPSEIGGLPYSEIILEGVQSRSWKVIRGGRGSTLVKGGRNE